MKKKIAVIGLKGLPAFGGAATVGENIIEQLKDEYDFTVYSVSSHTTEKTGYKNGYKQIVFKKNRFKKLNTIIYYIVSAFHAVFLSKYDMIHLHHRDASFILPLLRLRYKVLLTTHGMVLTSKWKRFSFLFKLQDHFFLRLANVISNVSKVDKEYLVNIGLKKSIVIPNGVNLSTSILSDESEYISFAAGRIIPSKGCDLFLKALIKLDYKGKVVIIGDYSQNSEYNILLKKLSESLPNVEFLGLIKDKSDLFNILSKSQLFVYPSLIESMSMMLLEVASLKIPIVCSNIKANTDVFNKDEVTFFQDNDVDDLAIKINDSIYDNVNTNTKVEKAYSRLEKDYTWAKIASRYSDVYNTLSNS